MLLLPVTVAAAYILTSIDLVLKLIEEPSSEDFKEHNHKRLEYFHKNRDTIKLAIMFANSILRVTICYTILSLMMFSPFENITYTYILSAIISVAVYVLFINFMPSVTFSNFQNSVTAFPFYPIKGLHILFYPFSKSLLWLRNIFYSGQMETHDKPISMEELSDAVEIVSKVNTMEEKRILTGMIRFANANVEDIMCHRTEMVAVDYSITFEELKRVLFDSGFSRIPVYKGNSDNIEGIIHLKDVLSHLDKQNFDWHTIIRKPLFAGDNQKVNELLLVFQKKKEHIAIVVDEYGSTFGLVTLEDVLEEIVGEINDEFDDEDDSGCRELADGTFIVEGKMPVSEFVDMLELGEDTLEEMPEEIDTVAGLIVELLQDFPKVGATVIFNDSHRLTVISMNKHRIDKIKIEAIYAESN